MTKEQFIRLFINRNTSLSDFKEAVIEYTNCTEIQVEQFMEYIKYCKTFPEFLNPNHLTLYDVLIQMQPYFEKKLNIVYLYSNGQKILL